MMPEFAPLSSVVGASVAGIDLRRPIGDAAAGALREAFARHSVLCVRGQRLSATEHARFVDVFGPVDAGYRVRSGHGGDEIRKRGVMLVSNIRKNGVPVGSLPDGEMQFHSDGAHRDVPYAATSLHAIRIPSRGGDTLFANLAAAWDALEDGMKARLEGLRARHVYGYDDTFRDEAAGENDADSSSATHDLVRIHPVTGRRSLYLSRLMTRYIVGMDRQESDALLDRLFDHAENPRFVYAHKWAVDDVLIWDNRCLNHARTDFPTDEDRLLRRYTISGF